MFCNKCGILVEENSKFCTHCGNKVESAIKTNNGDNQIQENSYVEAQKTENNIAGNSKESIQVENNISNKSNESHSNIDKKYNEEIIDPNTKVYSILGIAIPVISIVVYWNIGLSVRIALLLAFLGIVFTNKGKISNKTRATVGYIANFILIAMAVLMYITIAFE